MRFLKCILLISLIITVQCEEDDEKTFAVELTSETFDNAIQENNYFVMFFAPWCGHCKRLKPLWEQLAEMMNVKKDPRVMIAKVDCTQYQEVCSKYKVTGYPTLRFFKLGSSESTKFQGTRDLPTITDFIQDQFGEKEEENVEESNEIPKVSAVEATELTDETFMNHISKGKHFIKFYAPWCSHCQSLAPTWQELAESLRNNEHVRISKIDCTQYRPICQDYDVKGYPTLLWFDAGKKIAKYAGARSITDLLAYVEKMSGTASDKAEEEPVADTPQSSVLILTGENFSDEIQDGVTFVKFFAPWCGHCMKLSPVWEELATKIGGKAKVKVAKVDCTSNENKDLCHEQNVDGYPTLYIYKEGVKKAEYSGSRRLEDLYNFVGKYQDHDEL